MIQTPQEPEPDPAPHIRVLSLVLEGDTGEDWRRELGKLIERVDFVPLDGLGKCDLRVHGNLAVLLGRSAPQNVKNPAVSGRGFGTSAHFSK